MMHHRSARSRATVLLILAAALFSTAAADLLQVQVLHRHGERLHLSKNASLPGSEAGAPLLPSGADQLTSLGRLLRSRYLSADSPNRLRDASPTFSGPFDALSVSTNLDRTLSSARALLQGLYPEPDVPVPTKVFGSKENDFRLRGYTICPKFADRVAGFVKSRAFQVKARENKDLLKRLAAPLGEDASLSNIFNIFDRTLLQRRSQTTDADFAQIKSLADWVESTKFVGARGLIGGPLVGHMLDAADARLEKKPGANAHKLIVYSAHYPTLLGVLAALRPGDEPSAPADGIPPFGAALVWELHKGGRVRMLWYDGGDLRPLGVAVRGCKGPGKGCPLSSLRKGLGEARAHDGHKTFCRECGTNPRTSPVCAADARPAGLSDFTPAAKAGRGGTCGAGRGRAIAGALGAALGVLLGCLLTMCVLRIVAQRKESRERRMQMYMQEIAARAERSPVEGDDGRPKSTDIPVEFYMN